MLRMLILLSLLMEMSCKSVNSKNVRGQPTHEIKPTGNDVTKSLPDPPVKPEQKPIDLKLEAGPDLLTNKPVKVTPNATGATVWSWRKISGPGTVNFSAQDKAETTIEASADGEYVIELQVAAEDGRKTQDQFLMTWDTKGPEINATSELKAFQPIMFEAMVSADAVTTEWSQVSGKGKVTFADKASPKTMASADMNDDYTLLLSATDKAGNVTKSTVKFTWNTTDPMVSIGNDMLANKATTLTATSNGKYTVKWAKESGPGDLTFGSVNSPSTTVTASVDGRYTIVATATNNVGVMVTDKLDLIWDTTPPEISYASLSDLEFGTGRLFTIVSYGAESKSWSKVSGPGRVFFQSVSSEQPNVWFSDPGIYVVRFTVMDIIGNTSTRDVTASVPGPNPANAVLDVSSGGAHTCVLLITHKVRCWGSNYYGQLGYGNRENLLVPPSKDVDLGPGVNAVAISAGTDYTCALLENKSVRCWGGEINKTPMGSIQQEPIDLGPGRTATYIKSGISHSCAILDTGDIRCWRNVFPQDFYKDQIAQDPTMRGTVGTYSFGAGKKARALAIGMEYTCALLDDASVRCWGTNYDGQLGYGDETFRPTPPANSIYFGPNLTVNSIDASYDTACATLSDGSTRCWGSNFLSTYSDKDFRESLAPYVADGLPADMYAFSVAMGQNFLCVMNDTRVRCRGQEYGSFLYFPVDSPYYYPTIQPIIDLGVGRKPKKLTGTYRHICALLDDQTVRCWGTAEEISMGYGGKYPYAMPRVPVGL